MKIILDAMGGDNAPLEVIKGAVMAAGEYDAGIVLVGQTETIRKCAEENGIAIDENRITICEAADVITMEDPPLSVRTKKDSSMAVGLHLLRDGAGDAFVSAGNTGALYAGASLIVGRIKGYRKAAIATVMPFTNPTLLVDSGANITVTAENLDQFAHMGAVYMEKVLDVANPRVGLLNNGTESHKGTEVLIETYKLLSSDKSLNFIGNVEAKTVPSGGCDVLVTDGFTGNIFLKLTEGLGSLLFGRIKQMYKKNALTKLSAAMVMKDMKAMKKEFDASEYGGAPILGISRPVIKTHGSSDALEVKNAVRQAISYVNSGVILKLADAVSAVSPSYPAQSGEGQSSSGGNGDV